MKVRIIEFDTILDKFGKKRLRVCSHGFFHKDVLYPKGIKEKTELSFDSLKSAAQYAAQDIKDRWEWCKERYMKKIKK